MASKTILLVDDEEICREIISMVLERDGYRVECATDGVEALTALSRCQPDLILVDDQMPNLDGVGFLKRYRESSRVRVPVVLISADEDRQQVADAASLGMWDHFFKSQIAMPQTRKRIARYIGAREAVAVVGAV
jgi:CheY-like chemotaxis protein